nr:RNA-directed DNA polymerase, eukaryota [Tanacetum cinerariifolium]
MSGPNSVHNSENSDDYIEDPDPVTLISKLDISDPLHLHHNDTTALTVVSIKLKGTENYQVWSCATLLALEGKNKSGFINGTCKRSNTDVVLGRQWDRSFKGKNISNNNSVGSSSSSGFTGEQMATLIFLIKDNKNGKNVQANMTVDHPNGTEAFISKIGNLKLSNGLMLYDVLVILEYRVTLISVHKLAKENKIVVAFDENKCYFLNQDLSLRSVLGSGSQCEGLYYYNDKGCTPKDLWKVCNDYGTVVDVFIPNKKSKAVKRFAFVRFIKVINLDRLIENLNTIWIGRFHLFANPVRFERPKRLVFLTYKVMPAAPNDSCVVERDLSKYAMGKVKDVNSIPNLLTLLMDEGFFDVKLKYLGGMWVMFEFVKVDTKVNMMQHIGVKTWFHVIQDAVHDFVNDERIVWVDIEGIPLNVWSRETFMRIGKKWGETLDIEDNVDSSFGRKRLRIKTKQLVSILESFKIIFKGKVLLVRAKELFTWNPTFLAHKEMVYASEDESVHSPKKIPAHSSFSKEVSGDDSKSDVEEVSKTIFGDNSFSPNNYSDEMGKQHSKDPFKIYDILKKQTRGETREVSSSLSHPPGFTPEVSETRKENDQGAEGFPSLVNAKVMNNSQEVYQEINRESVDPNVVKEGGSILGALEDMIRVGQAMGYTMDGCVKDFKRIIGTQGADDVPRCISYLLIFKKLRRIVFHMDVKFTWGNSNYNYVYSEAVGNSGGIMCVWEANVFKKDYATISDNFVAIYGTWLPSNSKILFVAIYAPHQASCKHVLWEYVSTLIGRRNGETIIFGDFNEVRSIDERRGSCFNPSSARVFDHFISSPGLVDVKLEGYTFTWPHPSGSKMSKLDRFLASEGLFEFWSDSLSVFSLMVKLGGVRCYGGTNLAFVFSF